MSKKRPASDERAARPKSIDLNALFDPTLSNEYHPGAKAQVERFVTHGCPDRILSDNSHHPVSKAQVERILLEALKAAGRA